MSQKRGGKGGRLGQFYGKCFQIVATSEEVPLAAGICVDQRGTEVVEILQMFIEH